ncbi:MAG: prepilin-type N-terminal cleavage/methylation domain-containing protein [Gammaproteobacteria bacterium]|nr:prepilin-type N-terminal cleavage/methylation domain-containing protein [Gammaproteobacteria bacterium]
MRCRGFTLIESVMTILLLGILALATIPFLRMATDAYLDAQSYADLTARGRLALERLAREVRQALPNSIQTVAGGQGIEFVHAIHGTRYADDADRFDQDPDCGSGKAFNDMNRRFRALSNRTALYALDDDLATLVGNLLAGGGSPALVIANTTPGDLTAAAADDRTWVALAGTTATTCAADKTDDGTVLDFAAAKRFPLASLGARLAIADRTVEVGVSGATLRWHEVDGIDTTIYNNAAADWSGTDPVLVDGVTSVAFTYAPGSVNAAGVLGIALELSDGRVDVALYEEVRVRNVP